MIATAFLFVRTLCDCFKSRWRLEAEILVLRHQLNVLQQRAPRRVHLRWADRACSFGFIVAVLAFLKPFPSSGPRLSCVGIERVLPLSGDGSPVRSAADRGSTKRCAT